MYLRTICLVDFLGYMVYGDEYSNKLSQKDRTIAGYRSFASENETQCLGVGYRTPFVGFRVVSAVSRFGHESFRPWVVSAWDVSA